MKPKKREGKANLTAVDLFSGCGGLTLGLKEAGFKVVGAVDIDPLSVETYLMNHPEVRVWTADIRSLDPAAMRHELGLKVGQLTLMAGCPPCQGFSSVRTLNGKRSISDERNDLVFEYLKFVEEFRPKAVMMENVPALAKDHRMSIFQSELAKMGYHTDCRVLDAADYDVPQRRRRMILLAGKGGPIRPAAPIIGRRISVRDTIGGLPQPKRSDDPLHLIPERRSPEVMAIIRRIPRNGGSRRSLGEKYQLVCHKKRPDGFKDVYGRMRWDDVAPTITGGCTNPSKGRFLHPEQHRAITLREAALLQTFPADYVFSLRNGKEGVSLMIGNALPPVFIKHHALKIRNFVKG